jgi:hypothetical protein
MSDDAEYYIVQQDERERRITRKAKHNSVSAEWKNLFIYTMIE